jgi:hypothetical protein
MEPCASACFGSVRGEVRVASRKCPAIHAGRRPAVATGNNQQNREEFPWGHGTRYFTKTYEAEGETNENQAMAIVSVRFHSVSHLDTRYGR